MNSSRFPIEIFSRGEYIAPDRTGYFHTNGIRIMKLYNGIEKLRFGTPEDGVPSRQMFVKPPRREAIEAMPQAANTPAPEAIRFTVTSRGCRLEIPLAPGEDIYGLGLNLKSLRHTGKKRTLRVNSDPATDTGDSHAPAPLYFSSAGYGVLIDTARYATFYCGGNELLDSGDDVPPDDPNRILLTEAELYAARKTSAPMVIDIPAAGGVDVYFFSGPTLLDAVRRYVLFCGGGAMPPEWGLGCWYRTCGTSDAAGVDAMSAELREKQIPCDVLGLEPGWQSKTYSCSFRWSQERFPEPEKLISKLRERGYHVNLWEHLFTHPTSPIYEDLKPYAGDFKVWKGLVPDLTLPPAAKIFADYHAKNFTSKGISSFKLDECDNSDFIASPWSFPECSQFPSGLDGETMHSMLGMLYMETITRASRQSGIRGYGSVRNAHAFAPPQPYVLYSDLYDHAEFIRGVTSCGFSGMLWTPELRHARSPEDYLRRLEAMVLSPQMLLNIWSMPHPPWRQLQQEKNIAGEFYPPEEQARLEEATRRILELRMQFIPYLYEAFAEYHDFGTPPFRALAMDYPDEPAMRGIDYAWMAGDRLLVVPFRAGMTELDMPLPPGEWFDFYTGECHRNHVMLRPAHDQLPILVRGAAVVPLAEPVLFVADKMKFHLKRKCFGINPRPAKLFADDGCSFAFENDSARYYGEVSAKGALPPQLCERYELID